jgi:demethoxyubiquinone hydroxylase (CLK1/Coq7/Cat5 family)
MLRANPCKEGALEAIEAAEHYHVHCYDDALGWDAADAEIAAMLREFADDELRHKAFIHEQLAVAV